MMASTATPDIDRDTAFDLAERQRSVVNYERQVIRDRLVEAQNGLCAYCGQPMDKPTLDHVVAQVNGGTDDEANLVAACERCNVGKGDLGVEEFMTLRRMGLR